MYSFDPLSDSRWLEFVQHHPHSSVFHSRAWIEAIHHSYGYQPIAFTTSPCGADLQNAVVFCLIDSWLTGRRLVSLPFSDHCEPLLDSESDMLLIGDMLLQELRRQRLSYMELRPLNVPIGPGLRCSGTYCLHRLDLAPSLDVLYGNLHKNSTQRKIRRAERERLEYLEGRSDSFLDTFYRLWIHTRRRHLAPPQPMKWFRNLMQGFGEALTIRVASKDGRAVASILTLHHKDTLVYKYGCSDARFHNLGGMHLLFWKSVEEAKRRGLRFFDLGRSDANNEGLITFKNRWGAARSALTYFSSSNQKSIYRSPRPQPGDWADTAVKSLSRRLSDPLFRRLGSVMYRHIG